MEDTKIRHYPIEEREAIRSADGATWEAAFAKYLADIRCPRDAGNAVAVLDWLLGHAAALSYADNAEVYAGAGAPPPPAAEGGAAVGALSAGAIAELAAALKLPVHGDEATMMHALATVVEAKLSAGAIAEAVASKDERRHTFPLDDSPLGFSTGDAKLDEACKVLRLLHIADLRTLQTRINELVSDVQDLTANPRTNAKLGKVGRG